MNKLIVFLVVLALGGGTYYYVSSSGLEEEKDYSAEIRETTQTSAMRAEENMVVVSEQRPGNTIIGSIVHLAAPGYLVIHEDKNGAPGAIIGSSGLLSAGDNSSVTVSLSRASKHGEKLHAMLHFEKGGNATFAAAEDTPVPSALGGPISGWFDISNDSPDQMPVSI